MARDQKCLRYSSCLDSRICVEAPLGTSSCKVQYFKALDAHWISAFLWLLSLHKKNTAWVGSHEPGPEQQFNYWPMR